MSRQSNVICRFRVALKLLSDVCLMYTGVLTFADGDQSFFPVYEPTQEELKERYRAVEGEPDVIHYDSRKEGE